MHGTTFGGGPLACAVALQLLNTLEKQKMLKHIQKLGAYFLQQLRGLQEKHAAIQEVRGMGLMIGMDLESPDLAKSVFKHMLDRGVVTNRTDETVVRFLPPYIISKQHVDQAVDELDRILSSKLAAKNGAGAIVATEKRNKS
jgi:acetylornithine aminotransferase/acetylornithine/N-succinyldiaminopimelate aminotransferase